MMDTKHLVIGVLAVAVVIFATLYFRVPAPQPPLGALPGSSIPGEQLCINGVCTIYKVGSCTASSTPFSVRNPFNGTSTVKVGFELTGTSTSAISYDMGTSTLPSRPYTTAIGIAGMNFIGSSSVPIGELANFRSGAVGNTLVPRGVGAPTALTATEIEVAPAQFVILYATTTNSVGWGAGLDGLIRDKTTWGCRYSLEFRRNPEIR